MESLHASPDLALHEHECEDCEVPTYPDLFMLLRNEDEAECPVLQLWLACVEWAVPSLLDLHAVDYLSVYTKSEIYIHTRGYQRDWFGLATFRLCHTAFHNTSLPSQPIGKILSASTSSESTFGTIATWLQECLSEHQGCAQRLSDQPSKSLDRVRFLEIKEDVLLLKTNVDRVYSSGYACLSHCWGNGTDVVRTLEDNIQKHSTVGIRIDVLPKTFRDAVQICSRLKITYIWIDSLCIIQDNDEDWRIQAAFMADIYEHSRITIAASAAKGPTEGCFREADKLSIGGPLPAYAGLYIRREPDPPTRSSSWPLFQRGWVFQELTLSPRIIHFATEEVVWQCRTKRTRESQPNQDWKVSKGILPSFRFSEAKGSTLQGQWYDIVISYSWRTLTFRKDRLPAIAAIALRMQDCRPQDQYLAGLWRPSLCFDLLWFTRRMSGTKAHDTITQRIAFLSDPASRVPSWSWASTQHSVSWRLSERRALSRVEVLDITYVIDGPEVSGEIQDARITLRAPLLSFEYIRDVSKIRTPIKHGPLLDSEPENINAPQDVHSVASSGLTYSDFCLDDHGWGINPPAHQELFVLFLTVDGESNNDDEDEWQQALVVKEIEKEKRWIRLGLVKIHTVQYACEKAVWDKVESELSPFPSERTKEHQTRLVRDLEAMEAQVITSV